MKLRNFLENVIIVAILLVIVQTFLAEVAVYLHWSVDARTLLIYCGFIFDLVFSIEFLTRTFFAGRGKKDMFRYWFHERGWVDFLSSIPLLVLDSGPSVLFLLTGMTGGEGTGIGVLNVLKVVKAVRVTRILRLVRVIKIFGKIHNAESKMAQHHTAAISTTAVFTIVMTLIGFSIFTDSSGTGKMLERREGYLRLLESYENFGKKSRIPGKKIAGTLFKGDRNCIRFREGDRTLVENVEPGYFKSHYSHEDYFILSRGRHKLFISTFDIHSDIALSHIQSFIIIVFTVLAFMLIYTRHFVQNISDPTHILNKGFRKKDYNLQVKIKEIYGDHEIFRVSRFYNEAYLPAKLKRKSEEEEKKSSGLSMKDLLDFQGKGE